MCITSLSNLMTNQQTNLTMRFRSSRRAIEKMAATWVPHQLEPGLPRELYRTSYV